MVSVIKKKRYLLGALLAVMLTVVILLPLILSSDTVLRMVVSRINDTVPGRLSISSWLVGWQQGLLCRDIVYTDDQRGLRITIPRLTSTRGLGELIFAPENFGLVGLDSPVVELSGPMLSGEGTPGNGKPNSSANDTTAAWDKLVFQLQVWDGLVKTSLSDAETEVGIKNIDLHSSLSEGVIDFALKFQAIGEQGGVEAKGSLNLPARRKGLLETLVVGADVTINDYQFRDYLSFLAPYSNLPTGEGILDANFNVKVVGIEEVELSGTAGLADVRLAGGIFGKDSPTFQEITLSMEGTEWSRLYWTVKQLDLETDAGTFYFSGEQKNNNLQLKSRGTLNIPVLFDQFPYLLRVQEATLLESGSLDFIADLSREGHRGKLDVKARTENLGGLFNGNTFVWDNPLIAILHGEKEGLDFRIRRLQIEAPFAHAYGQGNLRSFELEASANVGTTLIELGKLFQHPWSGTGELELEAKAGAGESGDENCTVTTDLNIRNFSLNRSDTVIIPHHQFSVVGSAHAPLSLLKNQQGKFDLQFALSSWLGEVFLAFNGERKEKGLIGSRYSTDTNFNLDALSDFLHTLDRLPRKTKIAGDLQVQAAGYIDKSALEVDEMNSRIHDFSFARDDVEVRDKEVNLQILRSVNDKVPSLAIHDLIVTGNRDRFFSKGWGANMVHFPDRSLFLHNIDMNTEMGRLQLDELIIQDWPDPLKKVNAKFFVNGNMAELTPLLRGMHPLFGILATPTGRIDAGVDSLTWPLRKGGEKDAGFVVIMDTNKVSFGSTGFMREILSGFGLDQEKLRLKDSKIYCTGQDGRITCSPVRILAGDSEMVLSGSVGMDQSLDYLLQVPAGEKLVRKEGDRFPEGTIIRVPIKGTVAKPAIDSKKQAAAKVIEKKAGDILPELPQQQ